MGVGDWSYNIMQTNLRLCTMYRLLLQIGELLGKLEMFLITPDQKILRTPSDLKLYIAKSGAVVDSNIVNFALPKKTSKVSKLKVSLNV